MLFWIPLAEASQLEDVSPLIFQLEAETGLEFCGIPSSTCDPEALSSNPFFNWLRDHGRTAYVCHMPSTMKEIGDDYPALHLWQPDTQNFTYVDMYLRL